MSEHWTDALVEPRYLKGWMEKRLKERDDAKAALARAEVLLRRIERVMTNRLDTMTATGEDFSEADVKRWRDTLAAYFRDREGGGA